MKKKSHITVVKNLRDYSKESTFKKKAEKAQSFIKKNGLPDLKSLKKK